MRIKQYPVTNLTVPGDATIGDDLSFTSDAAVVNFGVDSDVTLTHVHDTGLSLSAGANLTLLEVISTEAGADGGPHLKLNRDSASPANNDYIGTLTFYGDNDAAESTLYARMFSQVSDVADGSEDARFYIQVMRAGAIANGIVIDEDEVYLSGTKGVTINGGNLTFDTAAKGVHLGVTTPTAANLLNDYEEGNWTAKIEGSTTDPTTLQTTVGTYTKVGREVYASVYMQNKNTTGASGVLSFTGLPFAAAETGVGSIGLHIIGATNAVGAWAFVQAGTTLIKPYASRNGNTWLQTTISAGTGRYAIISIHYTV